MPTKIGREEIESIKCKGGISFRCNHGPYKIWDGFSETHDRHKNNYYCRNCKAYMGCEKCCHIVTELICLRCHEWPLADGEREHGKMLSKDLIREKWKTLTQVTGKIGIS